MNVFKYIAVIICLGQVLSAIPVINVHAEDTFTNSRYEYQVPAKDKAGNIIEGQYKAKVQTKTTYDPNIISDEAFVNRGVEAFENFKGSLTEGESIPREWSFTDNNGLSWHGYTDGYGNPTSFFPE